MDGKIIAGAMLVGVWLIFGNALMNSEMFVYIIGAVVVIFIAKVFLHLF